MGVEAIVPARVEDSPATVRYPGEAGTQDSIISYLLV